MPKNLETIRMSSDHVKQAIDQYLTVWLPNATLVEYEPAYNGDIILTIKRKKSR